MRNAAFVIATLGGTVPCLAGIVTATAAAPATSAPIRVAITCEAPGRTKVCPAFLLGIIDANGVLLASPRAGADVLVFVTANEVGLIDRIHMRFVGQRAASESVVELDADVNTRDSDDAQRASVEPAFLRGIAVFVGAQYPTAVKTTLNTPPSVGDHLASMSPFSFAVSITGNGSYTQNYQTASSLLSLDGGYTEKRYRAGALLTANGGLVRQPPLMLSDGSYASLNSNQWAFNGGAEAVRLFDDTWSLGIGSYQRYADPHDQYRFTSRTRLALEWDMFPANDPRGNRLGVFYHVGWAVDRYNLRNVLGERFAQYPLHGVDAFGSVRHDKVSYGLSLSSDVQLTHPSLRYVVTAAPFVNFQVGDHVDVNLSFSVTRRIFPPPDPAVIDPLDYAEVSRLSFADSFAMSSSIGLTVHWDATNGIRNDRLQSI